jgi:hypothetical protein
MMGREIKRVPLDFDFPIGESFAAASCAQHEKECRREDHRDCEYSSDPPKGDGWQLWQTVSSGPISPVFATPEELVELMCRPDHEGPRKWTREAAESFVKREGWMPSMMTAGSRVLTTDEMEEVLTAPTGSVTGRDE